MHSFMQTSFELLQALRQNSFHCKLSFNQRFFWVTNLLPCSSQRPSELWKVSMASFPFFVCGREEVAKTASPWDSKVKIFQQLQRKPGYKTNIFSKSVPQTKHIGFVQAPGNFPVSYVNLVDKWEVKPQRKKLWVGQAMALAQQFQWALGSRRGWCRTVLWVSLQARGFPNETLIPVQWSDSTEWLRDPWLLRVHHQYERHSQWAFLSFTTASSPFPGIWGRCSKGRLTSGDNGKNLLPKILALVLPPTKSVFYLSPITSLGLSSTVCEARGSDQFWGD